MSTVPPPNPTLGVCYYPEHWPENMWAKDAKDMVELGLSWVRIGEFAWSRMEPELGIFKWDWLDRAIEILGQAGLHIVLGTPTATPPRWMIDKYPDMLAWDKDGRPRKFGSRRHYCFSHDGYQEEAKRIAEILAQRYGPNPFIKAWQIDNEYDCHDTVLSYSPNARSGFQKWLANHYTTIDALNAAWGNVFWSMEYGSFEQIDLPNLTVTEPNPAHVMDFRRFSSDQVVRFNRAQVEAIRPHSDAPLIHNYMGRILIFDHFKVGDDLDIASWDSYPLGFLEDRSDRDEVFKRDFFRQGDPDFQAFHHDLYRAVGKGRWWVMEQQPGPVNWAPHNPAPLPGMVRLWTWEAFAHGAEVVCFFRWRQAPLAQEQMHAGLQYPNGEFTPYAEEVRQVANELKEWETPARSKADVAIVFDYASSWAWEVQPQGEEFDYFRLAFDVYKGLRALGLNVDILPSTCGSFEGYKTVLIPGLFAWTDALRVAIKEFEGTCLIGPRSGSKTKEFKIPAGFPPDLDGLDIQIKSVESLRPDCPVYLEAPELEDGSAFQFWTENATTTEEVVLRTKDVRPALIKSKSTYYLCGWPDDTAMKNILSLVCQASGLAVETMTKSVRKQTIGEKTIYLNYGADPVTHNKGMIPATGLAFVKHEPENR